MLFFRYFSALKRNKFNWFSNGSLKGSSVNFNPLGKVSLFEDEEEISCFVNNNAN